jgi:L-ascorbate metabolism protein UlaG (beta-lactamase superfamily)
MNLQGSIKQGRKFINTVPTFQPGFKTMIPILQEYWHHSSENIPKQPLGPFHTPAGSYQKLPESGLRITWMGHACVLIEIDGKRILTDPVWSKRASFSSFFGPKRFFKAPIALEDLPELDAIIISHDHYDHLDKATIKYFAGTGTPFICTLGVAKYLKRWGVAASRITEMDWGNHLPLGPDCLITATPARHFSGRGITHRNETLWASFVIKGLKHNVYYGADSGWFEGFADIGNAFGPFDLTILGIGAYGTYWPDIHLTPENAIKAHQALKGRLMLPMHWGTFPLAPHPWYEPANKVTEDARRSGVDLILPEPGQPVEVTGAYNSEWWKAFK